MATGRRGIEVREGSIRVGFMLDGKYVKETLTVNGRPLPVTPKNIAHAERLAAEIRMKIKLQVFVLADYFPDSARAKEAKPKVATLGKLGRLYLRTLGALTPATRSQYTNYVNNLWLPMLGPETPADELTHADLAAKVGEHPWPSAKSHNNAMIPLRGLLGLHFRGARALESPAIGIENRKAVKKRPDPLTAKERDQVLRYMDKHYDERVVAYFTFAFYTGMRPEELIALRWGDVDLQQGVARVRRVRTFMGDERDETKTKVERDVDLSDHALAALKAMKRYTALKGPDADIFEHPELRKPWHDCRSQRETYWQPALRALGIRKRRAYATRHTYCTQLLMAGVNAAYIASQAGHSVKVLLDVYALWLPGQDGGAERAKARAAFLPQSFPEEDARNAKTRINR